MECETVLEQTIALLQHQRRISYGALKRRFQLDNAYLEDLKIELIEAQQLAYDSLPDIFYSLNCNVESHRNRIIFTQQGVQQSPSTLEQTQVTTVATMDNTDPALLLTQRPERADPDVGSARRHA